MDRCEQDLKAIPVEDMPWAAATAPIINVGAIVSTEDLQGAYISTQRRGIKQMGVHSHALIRAQTSGATLNNERGRPQTAAAEVRERTEIVPNHIDRRRSILLDPRALLGAPPWAPPPV